jgi:all-trans-retinol 13,14-reductase
MRERMLDAAEHVIPRIREHVAFFELGTPLTNDFYCETFRGACYGAAKTPWQVGPFACSSASSLPHLFFCGASTLSHGVGGAAMSGLRAAQKILGVSSVSDLLSTSTSPLHIYPAEHPEEWLKSTSSHATI